MKWLSALVAFVVVLGCGGANPRPVTQATGPEAPYAADVEGVPVVAAVDLCSLCSSNASCSVGTCTCNAGYVGDGRTCMPRTMSLSAVEAYLKASNTGAGEGFGDSVALSGDGSTLAVGAPWEDGAGTGVNPPSDEGADRSGAVYVYR